MSVSFTPSPATYAPMPVSASELPSAHARHSSHVSNKRMLENYVVNSNSHTDYLIVFYLMYFLSVCIIVYQYTNYLKLTTLKTIKYVYIIVIK